ncbi:hypothetical protein [Cupriavidus basilensis]
MATSVPPLRSETVETSSASILPQLTKQLGRGHRRHLDRTQVKQSLDRDLDTDLCAFRNDERAVGNLDATGRQIAGNEESTLQDLNGALYRARNLQDMANVLGRVVDHQLLPVYPIPWSLFVA